VSHTQRLAGLPFLIHRHEHGKPLVSVTSDKLFHTAAAPPCGWSFARSLRKTPLQRFHNIIIGSHPGRRFRADLAFTTRRSPDPLVPVAGVKIAGRVETVLGTAVRLAVTVIFGFANSESLDTEMH
jgi:hypothetical protein